MHTYDSTVYSFITFFLQVKQYKFSVLTLGAKYCVALFTTHAGSFPLKNKSKSCYFQKLLI